MRKRHALEPGVRLRMTSQDGVGGRSVLRWISSVLQQFEAASCPTLTIVVP